MASAGRQRKAPAKTERQFNLVLALTDTKRGFTKSELLQSVHGYHQRLSAARTETEIKSLDRMFERDKEDLKQLGIPVETFTHPGESGNNQVERYRIKRALLEMPDGLEFTKAEQEMLRAASFAWGQEHLSNTSRLARAKLTSLGAGLSLDEVSIYPSMRLRDSAAAPLADAIHSQKIVEFTYAHPERQVSQRRRVAPLHLEQADGRWHLFAWDYERNDSRTFLLRRIVSRVRATSKTYEKELLDLVPAMREQLQDLAVKQPAEVRVHTGSVAHRNLRDRALSTRDDSDGWVTLRLPMLDARELAQQLAGYGPDVEARAPESLVTHTRDMLTSMLQQHTENNGFESGTPLGGAARRRHTSQAALDATESVVFMLALLEYLRKDPVVSVNELSTKFGVTQEQVRHMVRFLAQSGVPGDEALYLPNDMIDFEFDDFEVEDMVVLKQSVAVEKTPAFTGVEIAGLLSSLQLLQEALPEKHHDVIVSVSQKLVKYHPVVSLTASPEVHDPNLRPLAEAISAQRPVKFQYENAVGHVSHRTIAPLRLDQSSGNWLVDGYCFDRHAPRLFRLDRISNLSQTDLTSMQLQELTHFQHEQAKHKDTAPAESAGQEDSVPPVETARVAVHENAVADLVHYEIAFDSSAGQWRLGSVELWHENSEIQMVAKAPGEVIFLEPESRRARIASWAQQALAGY